MIRAILKFFGVGFLDSELEAYRRQIRKEYAEELRNKGPYAYISVQADRSLHTHGSGRIHLFPSRNAKIPLYREPE